MYYCLLMYLLRLRVLVYSSHASTNFP
nr:unnamed protein product [Callosobruchus chinensis]